MIFLEDKIRKNNINKILILDFLAIGDLLFITPFLRTLRKSYSDAEIVISIKKENMEVIEGNPNVDKILYFDKYGEHSSLNYFKYIKSLRKEKPDLTITLQDNPRLALLSKLSGAEKRVGFSKHIRKLFYTDSIPGDNTKHRVDYYLDIAKLLNVKKIFNNGLEFYINSKDEKWAEFFLKSNSINKNNKIVGLNIGGSWKTKLWPVEKFAKLSDELIKNNYEVILLGGKKDLLREKEILRKVNFTLVSTVGETTLKQLGALINNLDCLISGDTGPMHIGVAMDTFIISLFGPTEPWRYRPYDNKHKIISKDLSCQPCHKKDCPYNHECMEEITVKDVISLI